MTDVRRQASRDSLVEKIEPPSAWTEDPSCHYLLVDIPDFKKEWLRLQIDDHGQILVGGEKQTENKIIQFEQTFKVPENSDVEKITGRYDGGILYVTVPKLVKDEERKSLKTATGDNIRGKNPDPKHDQEEHDKQQHEHHQEEHDKKHKNDQEHDKKNEHQQEEHDKKHKNDQEHDRKHEHQQEEHDKKHKLHQEEQGEKHEHEHHEEGHEGERHISHHGQIVEEGGFLGSVKEILYKNKGIAVTAVLAFALGVLLSQKFQSNAGSDGHLPPM